MIARGKAVTDEADFSFPLMADFFSLTKPRLLFIVLWSTLAGYIIPANSEIRITLLHLLLGTALTGAGAHALNQWRERVPDSKMRRTRIRPLPAGRVEGEEVLVFGLFLSAGGVLYLWSTVNPLTAYLGLLTMVSYVFIYTPLKQITPLNTWIGAVSGALPPVMGWAAQEGSLGVLVLPIFAVLYFWQLPHFFAIAWMYRDEYAKAGFRMLSHQDPSGLYTAGMMLFYGILLLATSISLFFAGQGGGLYLAGALFLGVGFLGSVAFFCNRRTDANAKLVFILSIVYLPLLFTVLAVDRLW